MSDKNFYCVAKGRAVGICLTYAFSQKQVDGFAQALHEGFMEFDDAVSYMRINATTPESEWLVYDRRGNGISLEQYLDTTQDSSAESTRDSHLTA